jgi:hypothetical protein
MKFKINDPLYEMERDETGYDHEQAECKACEAWCRHDCEFMAPEQRIEVVVTALEGTDTVPRKVSVYYSLEPSFHAEEQAHDY